MTTTATQTPIPTLQLGDRTCCEYASPPWTDAPHVLTVDGLRLETKGYAEQWADDNEGTPCTLHPEPPEWEYHLVSIGKDAYGNDRLDEHGWVKEAGLRPLPETD